MTDYCWNCQHPASLGNNAYCTYCLTYFYSHGRLPSHADSVPATDGLSVVYAAMGWSVRP